PGRLLSGRDRLCCCCADQLLGSVLAGCDDAVLSIGSVRRTSWSASGLLAAQAGREAGRGPGGPPYNSAYGGYGRSCVLSFFSVAPPVDTSGGSRQRPVGGLPLPLPHPPNHGSNRY